ncbi:MAG TPA: hypothetical protein VFI65_16565, partial [Streptosporangiaceae bacterium]|nr:hypothetical protein [Streptosporangiaceae bacterium]
HYWRDFLTHKAPVKLSAVTTFCDPLVLPAALVREELGLGGTPVQAAKLLADKFGQRQRLADAGLGQVPCLSVTAPGELPGALDLTGVPAVIKPRTSVGSAYTFRVGSKDQLGQVAADIPPEVWAEGMVIEAELPGRGPGRAGLADYVSVETLSVEGRHRPVTVTGRLALAAPFRERGGVMPAGLGQSDLDQVTDLAVAALDAIGVSDGVSHTEIKLQADGVSVIEVNGRLGGHIAWLWKRTGGGDLVALELAAACRADATRVSWPEPATDVVAFRYLLPAPMTVGRVRAVSGVGQARALPGVELVQLRARPGTVLDWRLGTGSYLALVSGATSTHDDLHRCIEQIDSLVRVDLDDLDQAPETASADENHR